MATETTSFLEENTDLLTDKERSALLQITRNIEDIPVLPATGSHLITVLNNPSVDARKIASIISRDPVIAAKTLRLANSAYYGVRNRITTLNHAVSMLGIDSIRQMVFGFYFMDITLKGGKSGFNVDRFWHHSMATAFLAEAITRRLEVQMVGGAEAYLAGLIHDIGKYLLYRHNKDRFRHTHEMMEIEGLAPEEAEREVFGIDHAIVGGWLAERWNLPPGLIESVVFHHRDIDGCVNKELVAVVMAADRIAIDEGSAYENGRRVDPLDARADALLRRGLRGIKHEEDTLDRLRVVLNRDVAQLEAFLTNFEGMPRPKGVETLSERPSAAIELPPPPGSEAPPPDGSVAAAKAVPAPHIPLLESLLLPGIAQIMHGLPVKGLLILAAMILGGFIAFQWFEQPFVSFLGIALLGLGWLGSLSDSMTTR